MKKTKAPHVRSSDIISHVIRYSTPKPCMILSSDDVRSASVIAPSAYRQRTIVSMSRMYSRSLTPTSRPLSKVSRASYRWTRRAHVPRTAQ